VPGYVKKYAVGCCARNPNNAGSTSYEKKTYDAVEDSSLPMRPGTVWIPEMYKSAKESPLERIVLLYSPCSVKHPLVGIFEQVSKHAGDIAAQQGIEFEKVVRDKTSVNEYESLPRVIKIRNNGQVFVYDKITDFGALYDWVMSDAKVSLKSYF
jgi:hypothetical protein